MSFTEQSQKLVAEIRSTVERAVEGLQTELRQRVGDALDRVTISLPDSLISEEQLAEMVQPAVEKALAERTPAAPPTADAAALRDALHRIDAARSQADVLRALSEATTHFAARCALFLVRGAVVRGWGGHGFDVDWSSQSVDPSAEGAWQRLIQGSGSQVLSSSERADLANRLDAPVAAEAVLVPLVLRDRVAAALYADRIGDAPFDAPALQTLAYVSALAIETLPLRERSATSTLTLEAPPEPAEAPLPAEPLEEPEPEPESELESEPESELESEPESVLEEPAPEVEAEPEEEAEGTDFAISEDTDLGAADLGDVDLEVEEEPAPPAPPTPVEEPAPTEAEADWRVEEEEPAPQETEPEAEPEPLESAPEPSAAPPPPLPTETPAASEAPPAETEPPAEAASAPAGKTPEVEPPEDVQGPGWAFSSTPQQEMDDEEEARHEEARRLARLLISEIKLYNEDQVQEGRKNNDVVERLKDDIDRSRQLYEERVDPRVRDKTDYFYQEMVRLLGAGDPKTLGI